MGSQRCRRTIHYGPHNIINLVREGAKRNLGTRMTNRKEPLKLEHIKSIASKANLDNSLQLRNVCMYSLAFAGLLRFDDLVRTWRNDLVFYPDYLRISKRIVETTNCAKATKSWSKIVLLTIHQSSCFEDTWLDYKFHKIARNLSSGQW